MNDEARLGMAESGKGLPVDFAEYLSERLHLPPAEALTVLGRCLLEYKPLAQRLESRER